MITKREAIIDLSIVGGCCLIYIIASFFDLPIIPVITVVAGVLFVFFALFLSRRKETWRDYGFRFDNLRESALIVGVPTGLLVIAILIWATMTQRAVTPGLLALTLIYPLWAVCQQFIFQGVVQRRLRILFSGELIPITVTFVAFAAVHFPDRNIMALTLVGGICWAIAYARCPNLWTIGLSHGLLAPLIYMLVLGERPIERFFNS